MGRKKITKEDLERLEKEEREFERRINEWNGFVRVPTDAILKKVKSRVSVEKLFKPEEFIKLCKYEKKRLKNISKNLTLMLFIALRAITQSIYQQWPITAGMPLPSENALLAKVGLPPRGVFKVPKIGVDTDSDDEWRPRCKPASKKPGLRQTVSDMLKRKKFITTKCLIANKRHDPDALKNEDLSQIIESWAGASDEVEEEGEAIERKERKLEEKKETEMTLNRYPRRNIPERTYTEPEVPEDDDYLYCEDCDKLYYGDCRIHGSHEIVPNTLIKWGLTNRARRTCPQGISVGPSGIRSGGRGVWADRDFPKNSVFGPYEGANVHKDDLQKLGLVFDGGYAWEIYRKGKLSHYVDGSDERKSSWLRFVNCARNEEEQTVVSYQYKGRIYYRAYKDIKKGMEILVWYGNQYAEELGISVKKIKNESNLERCKKFPDSYQECKKCGKVFADEKTFENHLKRKHPDRTIVKKYKCDFCSYSSDCKYHIDDHIRTHTKEKPFQCNVCGRRFSRKSRLQTHIDGIHKKVKHECLKCGKKFTWLDNLKKHIKFVHDKKAAHVCGICARVYRRTGNLSRHMLTHTGVRNYKCQFCDKRFTLKSYLTKHEQIHTGIRPYKCDDCKADFTFSSSLRSHVIVHHTKRYPHRCHLCQKGFLRPNKLKKHFEEKHKN